MSGVNFDDILGITLFIFSIWAIGRVFQALKFSPIVGEIFVGVLLGPNGLDVVPLLSGPGCGDSHSPSYDDRDDGHDDEDHDGGHAEGLLGHARRLMMAGSDCHEETSFWVMLGNLGVTLLIAESGIHVEFAMLQMVGAAASAIACIGTFFPIALGVLFAWLLGFDPYPDGLSLGSALAPTSVGIALKLLSEAGQLNSRLGQTVVTAAFVDDVMSLVVLTILMGLGEGSITAWTIAKPIVSSVVFVGGCGVLAARFFPVAMPRLLHFVDSKTTESGQAHKLRDDIHLACMLGLLVLYSFIGAQIGSHLLGAFIAGMSFCAVPRSLHIWRRQLKRYEAWLIRFFFAATVGFAIPINTMMSAEAFWKGLVVGLGPCVGAKMLSGFFLPGLERWVVGAAMVGRGEFAYLVAQSATTTEYSAGDDEDSTMMSEEMFSVAVWALLCATVSAPFMFKGVLAKMDRTEEDQQDKSQVWKIRVRTPAHHHGEGVLYDILELLHEIRLHVTAIEVHEESVEGAVWSLETFTVEPWDHGGNILSAVRDSTAGFHTETAAHHYKYASANMRVDERVGIEKLRQMLSDAVDDAAGLTLIEVFHEDDAPTPGPAPLPSDPHPRDRMPSDPETAEARPKAVVMGGISSRDNYTMIRQLYDAVRGTDKDKDASAIEESRKKAKRPTVRINEQNNEIIGVEEQEQSVATWNAGNPMAKDKEVAHVSLKSICFEDIVATPSPEKSSTATWHTTSNPSPSQKSIKDIGLLFEQMNTQISSSLSEKKDEGAVTKPSAVKDTSLAAVDIHFDSHVLPDSPIKVQLRVGKTGAVGVNLTAPDDEDADDGDDVVNYASL